MTRFGWMGVLAPVLLLACGSNGNTIPDEQAPLPDVARSSLAYDAAPSVDPSTESALVGDLNHFGLQVLQRLAPSDQNFVVSPVSGFIALTMTSAGAQGTTANEMKAVLYPNVSLDEIHPATNQLELRIRGYVRQSDAGGKSVELNLANDDFVQKDMAIEQPFLDALAVNYNCGVELVDYKGAPDKASALINNWVAKETSDKIQNVLPAGVVDVATRLTLVDSLYMYASWKTAFDPQVTYARTFHGVNGDGSTDFMNAGMDLSYATSADQGWAAVDVPYFGDALVFTAVLPDAGQLDTVKASLGAAWLASFDAMSQSQRVALSVPKFKLAGQTVSWNQTLQDIGMTTLFTWGACDLTGISSTESLYVKAVLQQVFVQLAEQGTEAAAATAVVVNVDGGISIQQPPPIPVVLDRPFLFFIRERGGPVLFAGQIMNLPAN